MDAWSFRILEPHRGAAITSLIGSLELIHQKIQDDTESICCVCGTWDILKTFWWPPVDTSLVWRKAHAIQANQASQQTQFAGAAFWVQRCILETRKLQALWVENPKLKTKDLHEMLHFLKCRSLWRILSQGKSRWIKSSSHFPLETRLQPALADSAGHVVTISEWKTIKPIYLDVGRKVGGNNPASKASVWHLLEESLWWFTVHSF